MVKSFLQMVKNLPALQETEVQSLGQEDPLKKEVATHSNIPTWEIPWREDPGGLQSMGSQRVRHNWATTLSLGPGILEVSGIWDFYVYPSEILIWSLWFYSFLIRARHWYDWKEEFDLFWSWNTLINRLWSWISHFYALRIQETNVSTCCHGDSLAVR